MCVCVCAWEELNVRVKKKKNGLKGNRWPATAAAWKDGSRRERVERFPLFFSLPWCSHRDTGDAVRTPRQRSYRTGLWEKEKKGDSLPPFPGWWLSVTAAVSRKGSSLWSTSGRGAGSRTPSACVRAQGPPGRPSPAEVLQRRLPLDYEAAGPFIWLGFMAVVEPHHSADVSLSKIASAHTSGERGAFVQVTLLSECKMSMAVL